MKILYLDAGTGLSGNMILGSVLDTGVSYSAFKKELALLGMTDSYRIYKKRITKCGISALEIRVVSLEKNPPHRGFNVIKSLITRSSLNKSIKEKSIEIFSNLATAEAVIHNKKINDIHFHEVGAVDAIVDIVGSVILFNMVKVDEICVSPLPAGGGLVKAAHGYLPVPAPATLELLKGIHITGHPLNEELTTPTGAAIVSTLAKPLEGFPDGTIKKIGYGAGTKNFKNYPNVLRAVLIDKIKQYKREDNVVMVETNIDDMTPEWVGYAIDSLLSRGALDVTVTPLVMKKSRPGYKISVLTQNKQKQETIDWLFNESTTLGLRVIPVTRYVLPRKTEILDTPYGRIRIKVSEWDGKKKIKPEYDDLKKISTKHNIPLCSLYKEVEILYNKKK